MTKIKLAMAAGVAAVLAFGVAACGQQAAETESTEPAAVTEPAPADATAPADAAAAPADATTTTTEPAPAQ